MINKKRMEQIEADLEKVIEADGINIVAIAKDGGYTLEECRYLADLYEAYIGKQVDLDIDYAFQDWADGRAKQEMHPEIYN